VNTSIGQGYVAVSPMLMAQVYQQIINDGELYKFRFLKEVRDGKTVVFKLNPSHALNPPFTKTGFPSSGMVWKQVWTGACSRG